MTESRHIEKAIAIRAESAAVWRVLVEPAFVRCWLSDAELEVATAWEVGGAMTSHGNWHGLAIENKGTIVALDWGRHMAYTHWSSLSQLPDTPGNYTHIRLTLSERDGTTTLALQQDNLLTYEIHGHWNFYWAMALDRIRRLAEMGHL
ncbi:hypothetical protein D3C72_617420 [compost metagenome]